MRTILLVDDDNELREILAESLIMAGDFEVLEAETATQGIETAKNSRFDMAILDVGLPDMDGRDLCKKFRKMNINIPILMLTGETGEGNEVKGLNSGANDYITKPFNINTLLARINAHFRQFEQTEDASILVADAVFEPGKKVFILPDETRIKLTEKEVGIMKYLAKQEDRSGLREDLLNEVWGYNNKVTTHTLETHIYRLRQKIEKRPTQPVYITTERSRYKLAKESD